MLTRDARIVHNTGRELGKGKKAYWGFAFQAALAIEAQSARWLAEQFSEEISEDTITNAAHASQLYHALRPVYGAAVAMLREKLNKTKWESVARIWANGTIILPDAFLLLHDVTEFTTREADKLIEDKFGGDPLPRNLHRWICTVAAIREDLYSLIERDVPKEIRVQAEGTAKMAGQLEIRLNWLANSDALREALLQKEG